MEEHFEISCDGERGIGEEGGDGVGKVGREDGEDEQGGGKVGTVQGEDLREEVVIGKAGRVEGEDDRGHAGGEGGVEAVSDVGQDTIGQEVQEGDNGDNGGIVGIVVGDYGEGGQDGGSEGREEEGREGGGKNGREDVGDGRGEEGGGKKDPVLALLQVLKEEGKVTDDYKQDPVRALLDMGRRPDMSPTVAEFNPINSERCSKLIQSAEYGEKSASEDDDYGDRGLYLKGMGAGDNDGGGDSGEEVGGTMPTAEEESVSGEYAEILGDGEQPGVLPPCNKELPVEDWASVSHKQSVGCNPFNHGGVDAQESHSGEEGGGTIVEPADAIREGHACSSSFKPIPITPMTTNATAVTPNDDLRQNKTAKIVLSKDKEQGGCTKLKRKRKTRLLFLYIHLFSPFVYLLILGMQT